MTLDEHSLGDLLQREDTYAAEGDCPPPETLLEGHWTTLDNSRRRALEEHVADCPRCQAERELAGAFERSPLEHVAAADLERIERRLAAGSPVRRTRPVARLADRRARRVSNSSAIRFAAAAVLAIAVGLLAWQQMNRAPAVRVVHEDIVRGAVLEAIAPVESVRQPPEEFVWSAAEKAVSYSVTLESVLGEVVWRAVFERPRASVPPEVAAGFEPAVRFRWTVEAFDEAGNRVARSPESLFWVTPRSSSEVEND